MSSGPIERMGSREGTAALGTAILKNESGLPALGLLVSTWLVRSSGKAGTVQSTKRPRADHLATALNIGNTYSKPACSNAPIIRRSTSGPIAPRTRRTISSEISGRSRRASRIAFSAVSIRPSPTAFMAHQSCPK